MSRKRKLRDLKKNLIFYIITFIMIFLSTFAFSGIYAYMDGINNNSIKYYEERNLQDLWLYCKDGFTKEDMVKVKGVSNVNNAERSMSIKASVLNGNNYIDYTTGSKINNMTLELNFIETNQISTFYYIQGEGFDQEKSGLWLDGYLAKNDKIQVGDILKFDIDGYEIEEKVVGLIMVPDHVYFLDENAEVPTHIDYGFAYLSINEFPMQYIYDKLNVSKDSFEELQKHYKTQEYYIFPKMIVDIENTSLLDETKKAIEEKLNKQITILDRSDDSNYEKSLNNNSKDDLELKLYSIVFIMLTTILVSRIMNRFVKGYRAKIITMKALGVKNSKIIWHYIRPGLIIGVISSALGIVFGKMILADYFFREKMIYFEIPSMSFAITPVVYFASIAQIAIIIITIYLSCTKILKNN
jgi:ABC-type lipoprotein release transport system permease subunit